MDEFLQHVKQQASPVIGRQIDCVLHHWHDLDAGKATEEEAGSDDQLDDLDDDPQDAHSHVGPGTDEAETVHSWGNVHTSPLHHKHCLHVRSVCIPIVNFAGRETSAWVPPCVP